MGFLDYASTLSLQKDPLRVKILLDHNLKYPTLTQEGQIPAVRFPEPRVTDEAIEFLGYVFPQDEKWKSRVGRLFRATVTHITTHTLMELPPILKTRSHPARFTENLLGDLYVDTYIAEKHPERLADLVYANALAMTTVKRSERIFLPATRIMTALMFKVSVGGFKGNLDRESIKIVEEVDTKLQETKSLFTRSLSTEEIDTDELEETAGWMVGQLRDFGPFVEIPCLPHTENASPCSIYTQPSTLEDSEIESHFLGAMEVRGRRVSDDTMASYWEKEVDYECLQVFNSTVIQRKKEAKILSKLEKNLSSSRFKSIVIPPENYSEYLRTRQLIGGSSRRLLNRIVVATNFEFEDIRKKYGVLDLNDAIQVVASKSPRNDIFMRDEIMKSSFSVTILFDVSRSMKVSPMENRARALCIAEAVKDIITDSKSWAFYAFSDRLYVIKDGSEAYSRRVRARIGGVPFDGATYMPDSIIAAADFLNHNVEAQRIIFVLSDGYPYGYPDMDETLKETIETYEEQGFIIIGIGFDTDRMSKLFKYNAAVYSQKDLIKKVGSIFLLASREELI